MSRGHRGLGNVGSRGDRLSAPPNLFCSTRRGRGVGVWGRSAPEGRRRDSGFSTRAEACSLEGPLEALGKHAFTFQGSERGEGPPPGVEALELGHVCPLWGGTRGPGPHCVCRRRRSQESP